MTDINIDNISSRDEKKNKILAAALKTYMEAGIENATLRQVAEAAGIGKSTIYEYFKSKEELSYEAFSYLFSILSEGRNNIRTLAEKRPIEAITELIDNTIYMCLNEPGKLLLIVQYEVDMFVKSNKYEDVRNDYIKKLKPVFQSLMQDYTLIIEKGIQNGDFTPSINLNVKKLTYILLSLIREIQAHAFIQERAEFENTCREVKETVFEVLGIKNNL